MENKVGGCIPAASVLNVSSISCNECPFPFCVISEAGILRLELREHLARIMRKLGNSVEETARAIDVSLRSVYRYSGVHEDTNCAQCNLTHSQDVMCRSDVYTVAHKDGQHVIILNRHRHATERELKVIECFTSYVFPSSVVRRVGGSHDHWVLDRVEFEEAEKFNCMRNALSKYMLDLAGYNQAKATGIVRSTARPRECLMTGGSNTEW